MHILLFFSGFLLKGLQRLACQLLNCLFAANTQGINYSFIKILLPLFVTALGLKLTTLHMIGGVHSRGCVWQRHTCMAWGYAWQGACIAGSMHGRGHAWHKWHMWQGACMYGGGYAWQGGHVWQGGMHGIGGVHGRGHVWQGICMHGRGHAWHGGGVHGR